MAWTTVRPPGGTLVLGALTVDADCYEASFDGRALELSPSQLELLALLVANPARVLSRIELSHALGLERDRSIDVMLSALRKVIGRDFVRNVRNRGWIVVPETLGS